MQPPAGRARSAPTSTRPRSVSFSAGITDRARNASSWNGASIVQPSCAAAATTACERSTTSASGASLRIPATGSGSSASTSPPSTATMPPPMFARRRAAVAIAASLMPTTTRLCASCESVVASAPRSSPNPFTRPRPIRPVPRWRSTTAIFAWSRAGSASASPARTSGSSTSDAVTIWPGISPITRACSPPLHGIRNISGPSAPRRTVCRTQSGTGTRGISGTGAPRFSTSSGTKRSRSGRIRMSAWQPGAIAPR